MVTREPEYFPPPNSTVAHLGRHVLFFCRAVGQGTLLLWYAIRASRYVLTKRTRDEVVMQMFAYGIKSLGVITVVGLFTGMILALQTGMALSQFNQEVNIGTAVMVSMLREMGPFMTGLILAACVGSAIAAQLGTMVVSEEIAALEIMSIDPVRFLVLPRLVAMSVMTPLLAFYTCIIGVIGGGIVGATQLGVSWEAYIDNATRFAMVKDLYVGVFKAYLFGLIITTVACHAGFATTQGAVGVGFATRKAVLVSFLLVLVSGYFVTRLFYA
ncbi:MAG: ABC transporter permease [Verrucomicrobia bacterium]|jgi:phospholipid/cholesterol/gamma-HCH transport system permease protein|nr:ABC transporter permease [Verrucomicrobiota bacterium]MBT7065393.1 ABC transporter permease [Verrucomicrobiota bacterium]MBT7699213.1 ABC transporter permease [Verrucomicrobiota bacterium]